MALREWILKLAFATKASIDTLSAHKNRLWTSLVPDVDIRLAGGHTSKDHAQLGIMLTMMLASILGYVDTGHEALKRRALQAAVARTRSPMRHTPNFHTVAAHPLHTVVSAIVV